MDDNASVLALHSLIATFEEEIEAGKAALNACCEAEMCAPQHRPAEGEEVPEKGSNIWEEAKTLLGVKFVQSVLGGNHGTGAGPPDPPLLSLRRIASPEVAPLKARLPRAAASRFPSHPREPFPERQTTLRASSPSSSLQKKLFSPPHRGGLSEYRDEQQESSEVDSPSRPSASPAGSRVWKDHQWVNTLRSPTAKSPSRQPLRRNGRHKGKGSSVTPRQGSPSSEEHSLTEPAALQSLEGKSSPLRRLWKPQRAVTKVSEDENTSESTLRASASPPGEQSNLPARPWPGTQAPALGSRMAVVNYISSKEYQLQPPGPPMSTASTAPPAATREPPKVSSQPPPAPATSSTTRMEPRRKLATPKKQTRSQTPQRPASKIRRTTPTLAKHRSPKASPRAASPASTSPVAFMPNRHVHSDSRPRMASPSRHGSTAASVNGKARRPSPHRLQSIRNAPAHGPQRRQPPSGNSSTLLHPMPSLGSFMHLSRRGVLQPRSPSGAPSSGTEDSQSYRHGSIVGAKSPTPLKRSPKSSAEIVSHDLVQTPKRGDLSNSLPNWELSPVKPSSLQTPRADMPTTELKHANLHGETIHGSAENEESKG